MYSIIIREMTMDGKNKRSEVKEGKVVKVVSIEYKKCAWFCTSCFLNCFICF